MQLPSKTVLVGCLIGFLWGCVACDPTDDERCGEGSEYTFDKDHCDKNEDESNTPVPDPQPDDAGASDGAVADDMPTGLGEPCTSNADCEGFDADFCPFDPTTGEGSCTLSECTLKADTVCPTDWQCCDFPEYIPYPPFCVPAEAWGDMNDQLGCTG